MKTQRLGGAPGGFMALRRTAGRNDWLYALVRVAGKIWFSKSFRIEVEGRENLDLNSPVVLLPKHQRWEDIPLLGIAAPRPLYYVAKYELFTRWPDRWFLRSLGGIPLNRGEPIKSRESLREIVGRLGQGQWIALFPEGTYYLDSMGPGNVGILKLILSRISPPLVPVGIRYMPFGHQTLVRIRFGRAFYNKEKRSVKITLEKVMCEIARLSGFSFK